MPKIGKKDKVLRDEGNIVALLEELASEEIIILEEKSYTRDELLSIFKEHLEVLAEIRRLTIARDIAIALERKLEPRVKRISFHLGEKVKSRIGRRNPLLKKYGFEPEKKPHVPVEAKARAVVRRLETRKLRGTMGRKQRALAKKKLKAGG